MNRSGLLICIGALCAVLTACHPSGTGTNNGSGTSSASASSDGPAKPGSNADESTWDNYLVEQGHLHGKDVAQRPYIYLIPSGDSIGATDRRKNEIDSISHSIGPILMPGGMLILGGPDAQQTNAFVADLSKTIKAGALKGIVVLVVSDSSPTNSSTLKPTGAAVRLVTM